MGGLNSCSACQVTGMARLGTARMDPGVFRCPEGHLTAVHWALARLGTARMDPGVFRCPEGHLTAVHWALARLGTARMDTGVFRCPEGHLTAVHWALARLGTARMDTGVFRCPEGHLTAVPPGGPALCSAGLVCLLAACLKGKSSQKTSGPKYVSCGFKNRFLCL